MSFKEIECISYIKSVIISNFMKENYDFLNSICAEIPSSAYRAPSHQK